MRFQLCALAGASLVAMTGAAMTEVELPAQAQCYFDAVAAKDAEAVGACFAEDGWILDVSREIKGREAIVRWAENEVIGGTYTIDEVTQGKDGVQLLVTFTPPGASSGFRANYVISIRDGIASMVLTYA
jgi:hypothetical protein